MLKRKDIRTVIPTNGGNPKEKFGAIWDNQINLLRQKFSSGIQDVLTWPEHPTDIPTIFVAKKDIIDVLSFLKNDAACAYEFLSDITATDEGPTAGNARFHVVYHLLSHKHKFARIRLKVKLADQESIATATTLWTGANWAEREVWDMFGIKFDNHPNLIRILMDERWVGHPLRKDYPLRGYQSFDTPQPIHPEKLV